MSSIEDEFLSDVVETKTHAKKRKNSKVKGNRGENDLVHILNERFKGYTFARSVSSGAYTGGSNQSRANSLTEEQRLVFSGDIRIPVNFKFTIEHKFYNSFEFWWLFSDKSTLYEWYKQSETDAKNVNKKPMLIVKCNNHKRIVFVNIEDAPKKIRPVFVHENKCCYGLEELLILEDEYFFD